MMKGRNKLKKIWKINSNKEMFQFAQLLLLIPHSLSLSLSVCVYIYIYLHNFKIEFENDFKNKF